ncbi:hypothetical protein [Gimesia sp.]|uniref:hypothetical protein n=1 Tax=Gimesia sp. TaxID=2024833 RepID=UPI003A908AEF
MSLIKSAILRMWMGFCLVAILVPNFAQAEDALHLELTALAQDIYKLVDKRGGGAVAVGGFTAASNVRGSSGPDVQLQLSAALQKTGLTVNFEEYKFEVTGNYLGFTDKETGAYGVKIVSRVIDSDGTTLAEFPRLVFGEETVPRMLGISVKTPPNDSAFDRSRKIKDALKNPQVNLRGTRIATTVSSPYSVEILVKDGNDYVARSATLDSKRRPFVGIKKDEVYAVRLVNESDHEAAVNLSIDGINNFCFSKTKSTYWIVPAKSTRLIKGWHKDSSTSIEFKVTGYADTATALLKLKPSTSIGQISAAFSASWGEGSRKPHDEASSRGTGFGDEVSTKTKQVTRFIGHVRDVIVVRYEK